MYKILLSSPIHEASGFGTVGRAYAKGMIGDTNNFDIKIDVVNYSVADNSKYLSKPEVEIYEPYIIRNKNASVYNDRIFINHITPNIAYKLNSFKHNILYSIWETSSIPKDSNNRCNQFDLVLTASEYSKDAFINGGVKVPIGIVPHIVEPQPYFKENKHIEELTKDKFVFLSVFEWHLGKGYDTLIKGYIEAFQNDPDVVLLLKVNSFVNLNHLKEEVYSYIKSIKKDLKYPQIIPIVGPLLTEDLYSLYKYAHCYVSCSRREGFSICACDALVNGKVVIAPDKGGHRYFLNPDNSVLIPSEFKDIINVEDERSIYKGQQWIEMDYGVFIQSMQAVKNECHFPTLELSTTLREERKEAINLLSRETVLNLFIKYFESYDIKSS